MGESVSNTEYLYEALIGFGSCSVTIAVTLAVVLVVYDIETVFGLSHQTIALFLSQVVGWVNVVVHPEIS
jgi:hypothetical protein